MITDCSILFNIFEITSKTYLSNATFNQYNSMKSQAYFEKIHKHIENNLKASKTSIRIAVAWFTDSKLFDILCEKAKEGIQIELLIANHEINLESTINYRNLTNEGGQLFLDW